MCIFTPPSFSRETNRALSTSSSESAPGEGRSLELLCDPWAPDPLDPSEGSLLNSIGVKGDGIGLMGGGGGDACLLGVQKSPPGSTGLAGRVLGAVVNRSHVLVRLMSHSICVGCLCSPYTFSG